MGLLCAEQNVGHLKKCIFKMSGTLARRTKRRKPQKCHLCTASEKAHVLALNTAHVLRPNKAEVLALNKAHVLRLNTKICPMFTANTKEAAFGRPPFVASFVLM